MLIAIVRDWPPNAPTEVRHAPSSQGNFGKIAASSCAAGSFGF